MTDLIDRQAILKHIEKIRQGVQMMDDTHRASIIMNGMHLCEEAVRNQPSAQPEVLACGSGELVQESYSLVEDCISRQEAIVAINHICPVDTEYDCTLLDRVDVRCVLSDLPSADQNRWIPCSERLPEKPKPNPDLDDKPLGLYLVCAKGGTPFRAFWNGKTFADGWSRLEVDAWMPLPPSYRGKNDG